LICIYGSYFKEQPGGRDEQRDQIFQNALDFTEVKVREWLVPRKEIVAISWDEQVDGCATCSLKPTSKILVYRNSIDNIIGFVHSSEMFKQPERHHIGFITHLHRSLK